MTILYNLYLLGSVFNSSYIQYSVEMNCVIKRFMCTEYRKLPKLRPPSVLSKLAFKTNLLNSYGIRENEIGR